MNRHAWLLLSGCLWAAMMFLLFEREIRPFFEYQQPPSYRTLLQRRREPEVEHRTISLAAEPSGEAETLTVPLERGGHAVRTRVWLKVQPIVPLSLADDRTFLSSEVTVDERYELASFEIEARMHGLRVSAWGVREEDGLRVRYDVGPGMIRGEQRVEFPSCGTLADSFLPYLGGGRLTVGKKWKMRILDLDNVIAIRGKGQLSFADLYAMVVARERLKGPGLETEAFKVEVRKSPNDPLPAYSLWVDDDGKVVRQEMIMSRLQYTAVLDERRMLSAEEAGAYAWRVRPPR